MSEGRRREVFNAVMKSKFENVPPPIHRILKKAYASGLNSTAAWKRVSEMGWRKNEEGNWVKNKFNDADMKIPDLMTPDQRQRLNDAVELCVKAGGDRGVCLANALGKLRTTGFSDKRFQNTKTTPPDPRDGHTHIAAYDENGDGATSQDGLPLHNHMIRNFRTEPFYGYFDPDGDEMGGPDNNGDGDGYYCSVHPGSLAFKQFDRKSSMTPAQQKSFKDCMESGGTEAGCMEHIFDKNDMAQGGFEMEIFRVGTHNGDDFTEADLAEIASNFHALKDELRPKLKITHRDHQETVAGLASYGDITDVYLKQGNDGQNRLYAWVDNVPPEVMGFVKNRRFPERSIEIYPSFKLGTVEDSPVYKNVLKAVALLGHEMPAVTGMEPIKLEECLECQGTVCFREQVFKQNSGEGRKINELAAGMKALEADLAIETHKPERG